jgi:hypothetical protein
MGVISDLVRMKGQKDLQAKQGTIDALKIVLTNPNATPEAREWANTSLVGLLDGEFGTGGGKGKGGGGGGGGSGSGTSGSKTPAATASGGGSIFHHILSGLNQMNPYTAGNKTKQAQQQIAGSRPQKMELTQDEQEQLKLKNQKLEADQQLDQLEAKEAIEDESKFDLEKKIAEFKSQQDLKAENDRFHQVYDRAIANGQSPEQALQQANESVNIRTPVDSSTEKLTLTGPKGEDVVLFRSPSTGKVYNLAHREVNVDQMIASGQYKYADKTGSEQGAQLKQRESILRDLHPDWSDEQVKQQAAKDTLKSLDLTDRSKQVHITIAQANAGNAQEQRAAAPDIAQSIIDGTQPPDSAGLSRSGAWMKIRSELAKKGFNLSKAELDWKAAQRYVSTLNSAQQVRIREAASTVQQMLPDIQNKYEAWKRAGLASGIRIFNRAGLTVSKNLPGPAGVAAQALDTQIADMVAELGQLYMGGNSPTDHSLKLAEHNLKGDWTPEQFNAAVDLLKKNLGYRVNSIMNAGTAGMSEGSPYTPQGGAGIPQQTQTPQTQTTAPPKIKIISIK